MAVSKAKPVSKTIDRYEGHDRYEDSAGRTIYFKALKLSEQMRLIRIIGSEGADSPHYFNTALAVASVRYIDYNDGEGPVPMPFVKTEDQLYAAIDKVETHGLMAISQALNVQLEEAMSAAEVKDQAKN